MFIDSSGFWGIWVMLMLPCGWKKEKSLIKKKNKKNALQLKINYFNI